MKKPTVATKIGRGLAWSFLPVAAFSSLRNLGGSVGRTRDLLRPKDAHEDVAPEVAAQIETGKAWLASLDDRERFEHFYVEMGWEDGDVEGRLRMNARSHAIRLGFFWLAAFMVPVALVNYGIVAAAFDAGVVYFLLTGCIRDTAYRIQLADRALYSMKSMRQRDDFWVRCLLSF